MGEVRTNKEYLELKKNREYNEKIVGETMKTIEAEINGIKKGDTVIWSAFQNAYNSQGCLVSGIVENVDIIEIREGDRREVLWIEGEEGYMGVEDVYTRKQIDGLFEHPIFKKEKEG